MLSARLLILASVLAITIAGPIGAAVRIVSNGKPIAVIVTPDAPTPVVKYAAQELQYHIEQSTGVKLETVSEDSWNPVTPGIILGVSKAAEKAGIHAADLKSNEFILRTVGQNLFIVGEDTTGDVFGPYNVLHENYTHVGTLLGVYDLLKNQLGVKWLWPGKLGEVIPKRSSIDIGKLDKKSAPRLIHTRIRDGVYTVANPAGWSSGDQYYIYTINQTIWLRRQGIAMALRMDLTHSYTDWWTKYSLTHPEFFNLLPDGTRRPNPYYWGGDPTLISMCVSEPGLWKQKVENWKALRSPLSPYLDVSEDDTTGNCTCERCMSWDVPNGKLDYPFDQRLTKAKEAFAKADENWPNKLGNVSDRYAKYYIEVQKEAQKVDPNAVVMGFAYANYTVPPVQAKLNDKVIVAIVPALMFPWTSEKIKNFRTQWQGWAKTGCRLMLRPNYTLDGGNMPIFYARKLGDDLHFAGKHGMIATDFDSLTGQWATQGPNLYVLARMQAQPELSVDQVLNEYYSGFGPAAKAVKAYFTYWEKVSDSITDKQYNKAGEETKGDWPRFVRMAGRFFTPDVMAKGKMLLIQAYVDATGDSLATQRVEFLSHGLENARLTLEVQDAFVAYKAGGSIEPYKRAINTLDTFRKANESSCIANMGFLSYFEGMTWDRKLLKEMDTPGEEIGGTWKFQWDPDDIGLTRNWQADMTDTSKWLDITTNGPWEDQPVGKAWEKEHKSSYDGIAWYRKEFSITPEQAAKKVKIVFGAVDEACKVFLNGKQILDRPFPFEGNNNSWQEAFSIDIKPFLRTDKPNDLAVRVADSAGAGGIWRPVWLVVE